MKKGIWLVFFVFLLTEVVAQKEINISQYMLSRYSINSAFGGSHEALSLLGSYRHKWSGINKAPSSEFFSAHAPLKNESVALGVEIFSQNISVVSQKGFAASYTYRVRPADNTWLGLSLSGGMSFSTEGWADVPVKDANDPSFLNNERNSLPVFGIGSAWYGKSFFVGVSVPNFFYGNLYTTGEPEFAPGKASYLLTGGYTFSLGKSFKVQPSTLAIFNKENDPVYDISGSVIWNDAMWIGVTYRTSEEIVGMAAYQVLPQLRIAYSFDSTTGNLQKYNNGTHEISLQFDFGYKINTPSPKFF